MNGFSGKWEIERNKVVISCDQEVFFPFDIHCQELNRVVNLIVDFSSATFNFLGSGKRDKDGLELRFAWVKTGLRIGWEIKVL